MITTPTGYFLTIPVSDPKMLLNANERLHWRSRNRKTQYWRSLACTQATSAINTRRLVPLSRVRIEAWFTFPTLHRRDVGNLQPTAKALVDGLVDAELLPDDNDKHVVGPDCRRSIEKGPHAIRLVLEVLGEDV